MNPQKNRNSSYRQRQERRRKSFYDHRRRHRNTANVVPTYSDVSNIKEAINGMEAIEETGDQIDDACRKVCM